MRELKNLPAVLEQADAWQRTPEEIGALVQKISVGFEWAPPPPGSERIKRSDARRGSRVHKQTPGWLKDALNRAYRAEAKNFMGPRSKGFTNQWRTEMFLMNWNHWNRNHVTRLPDIFDHFGSDADGNLVCEPYFGRAPEEDYQDVERFARRLGCRVEFSLPSWHSPEDDDCVRITFFRPETIQ